MKLKLLLLFALCASLSVPLAWHALRPKNQHWYGELVDAPIPSELKILRFDGPVHLAINRGVREYTGYWVVGISASPNLIEFCKLHNFTLIETDRSPDFKASDFQFWDVDPAYFQIPKLGNRQEATGNIPNLGVISIIYIVDSHQLVIKVE